MKVKKGKLVHIYPYDKLCMVTNIKTPTKEEKNFIKTYWKTKHNINIQQDFDLISIVFINSKKEYYYPNCNPIVKKIKFSFLQKKKFFNQFNKYASEEIKNIVRNIN